MEGLNDVKQELEQKRATLAEELDRARDHMKSIEADLKRVDEALGALTGSKKKSRSRSRSKKAAPAPQAPLPQARPQTPVEDPWSPANTDDSSYGFGGGSQGSGFRG
jgi:septal ring factor EnvC (AmiA/AmiB activator)